MSKAPTPPITDVAVPTTKNKSKLIIILIAVFVLLLAGGGAAAWYFMSQPAHPGKKAHVEDEDAGKPPVYVVLDQFTVNLAPDGGDSKFLQIGLTVQVPDDKAADNFKTNMPVVKSRILMLLSSQKADDLLTESGKSALIKSLTAELTKPFVPNGTPQKIRGVFITSFVIQ